jgi:hypothetical protein
VVNRVFGAEPLHARYFAPTGLGGRTKSFSPFAPVDPVSLTPKKATIEVGETVDLTAVLGQVFGGLALVEVAWESSNIDPELGDAVAGVIWVGPNPGCPNTESLTGHPCSVSIGEVTGTAAGTAEIEVTYTVTIDDTKLNLRNTAEITVVPPMRELTVELENLTPYVIQVTDGGDFTCSTGPDTPITCTKPWYQVGSNITLTATGWTVEDDWPLTGFNPVKRHDITISGLGCEKLWPKNGEPTAFCTFQMSDGTPTISFKLTH